MIGEKYYNSDELITIYGEYTHSLKVKNETDKRYRYIKKDVLNEYTRLIPLGYITIFYVYPEFLYDSIIEDDIKSKTIKFKDVVLIFDPDLNSMLWDHSENCAPTLFKTRFSDCIFSDDYDEYRCMTLADETWVLSNELAELDKQEKFCYEKVAIYIDTSVDDFLALLQNKLKIFDEVVKESSIIVKEQFNSEYEIRTNLKDLIEFLGFYMMLGYVADIQEENLSHPLPVDTEYGLITFPSITLESMVIRLGENMENILILRYWYDLNLNTLSYSHALVRDSTDGKMYVLLYNPAGISELALNDAFSPVEQQQIFSKMEAG